MPIRLSTERLVLREPETDDALTLRDYYLRNRDRFEPWDPVRSPDVDDHARWIAEEREEARRLGHAGHVLAFDGDALVAVVGLTGRSMEDPPGAMLSYSVDGAYEGRGYAFEAVRRVIRYAFEELGIGVLSAHYHPENARSERLLKRLGFTIVARTPAVPGLEALLRPQVFARLEKDALPTGSAFEAFRAEVHRDAELQGALAAQRDRGTFVELVLRLAAGRGYTLTREDVETALRDGLRAWLERWIA